MLKGGILICSPRAICVCFDRVLSFKPYLEQQKIIKYWNAQGFAESELLPYSVSDDGLIVTRDLPSHGFYEGTNTLDKQIYNLPF